MTFIPPSHTTTVMFLLIVTFVIAAIIGGVYHSTKSPKRTALTAAAIFAWLTLTSLLVTSGFIAAQPMPRVLLFFALANLAALVFALSRAGGWLAGGTPIFALVLFQAFRLPLELVLHSWADQGTIPESMTWNGSNFDIITGIVTLTAAPFAKKYSAIAWVANIVGFVLLINVGRVAAMSSPLPFAWQVDPPLQLALYFPYCLIGTVCVAGALAGHVVLTRALFLKKRATL